jgi:hypothetical protein
MFTHRRGDSMKLTLKITSYGLASLVLVIITYYFQRSFFEVLNSGMEVRITNLGIPFQLFKVLFIIVNLVGSILCLFLIIKNDRKFIKVVFGLVLFDLFYSFISFFWVAIAYEINEKPNEHLLSYILKTIIGNSQEGLNSWDGVGILAPTHIIRFLYLMNLFDTLFMVVVVLLLILLKHILDKKVKKV